MTLAGHRIFGCVMIWRCLLVIKYDWVFVCDGGLNFDIFGGRAFLGMFSV